MELQTLALGARDVAIGIVSAGDLLPLLESGIHLSEVCGRREGVFRQVHTAAVGNDVVVEFLGEALRAAVSSHWYIQREGRSRVRKAQVPWSFGATVFEHTYE